jgi:hypothetical protein
MPLMHTPPLTTSAPRPKSFQSVTSAVAARWPPDEWPIT